ncbi:MAG TPA: DUF4907 domain-containing protein [Chitinophagales bacterium]|nr:DUF4907 domain-containing protein [Chitinophagales bacterium]
MSLFKQSPLFLFLITSLLLSCSSPSDKNQSGKNKDEKIAVDSGPTAAIYPSEPESDSSVVVTVKTFRENSAWGYDILMGDSGKLYIHQPTIPSVPGNNGFKTEADAKKAGEFVAYKIRNHIMPPSVTPEELDSMGLWKK